MSDELRHDYLKRSASARNEQGKLASESPLVKAAAVWGSVPEEPADEPVAPREVAASLEAAKEGVEEGVPARPHPSVAATWNVGAEQTLEKVALKLPATMEDWARFVAWGERMNQPDIVAAFHALLDEAGA